jgi:hypothetical protein
MPYPYIPVDMMTNLTMHQYCLVSSDSLKMVGFPFLVLIAWNTDCPHKGLFWQGEEGYALCVAVVMQICQLIKK